MSKTKSESVRVLRNQLASAVRMRKAAVGIVTLLIALGLLLGPKWEGDSTILLVLSLFVAFVALGLAYTGLSQAMMGWSKESEIDLDKREIRHYTASLFGRSRPFSIPFSKISSMEAANPEFAASDGMAMHLKDDQGRVMMVVGLFEDEADILLCKQQITQSLQNAPGDPN
ncbi:hypothetical protein [Cohaesibacter gelatinilyticus]|uniref:Uncharacterized protein n=1 Tax=Cohaesibacter gelatinilyticus TaxID=372072 RepID=A0A285N7I2_9HYPH|nr:hypothetical protein [Cohaesibacter gelatinilyticus]SNZ05435.1 hypothetical protein SAMN06265368_0118 [Cohaesibacter gelatinilyticus]